MQKNIPTEVLTFLSDGDDYSEVPPNKEGGDNGVEYFTEEEKEDASFLRQFPIFSRAVALYIRTTGTTDPSIRGPYSEWPAVTMYSFMKFIVSLGGADFTLGKVGELNSKDIDALVKYDISTIKASLTKVKRMPSSIVTDRTLVGILVSLQGASMHRVKTLNGDVAQISAPGFPSVDVQLTGSGAGRILVGGAGAVETLNATTGTRYVYANISEEARLCAFFLLSRRIPKITDKELGFMEAPPIADYFVPAPATAQTNKMLKYLEDCLKRAFENERLSNTIGFKADRLSWVEWYLHQQFDIAAKAEKDSIKNLVSLLKEKTLGRMVDGTKVMDMTCPQFAAEVTVPGTLIRMHSYHDVYGFVDKCRANVRNMLDVPRKHDSPHLAKVWDGATSVPVKFDAPIKALLENLEGVDYKEVMAVGTGKSTHFYNQVKTAFGDKVVWMDLDPKKRPFHDPNNFVQFDIMGLSTTMPEWGKGKVIIDDTLPVINNRPNSDAKLGRMVGSSLRGGIVKMYLGAGDETQIGKASNNLALLRSCYGYVRMFPGGGPHSPEYFVVFANRKDGKYWFPQMDTVKAPVNEPIYKDSTDNVAEMDRWALYNLTFLTRKAMEVVAFNLFQNAQVREGKVVDPFPTYFEYRCPDKIRLSGFRNAQSVRQAIALDESVVTRLAEFLE